VWGSNSRALEESRLLIPYTAASAKQNGKLVITSLCAPGINTYRSFVNQCQGPPEGKKKNMAGALITQDRLKVNIHNREKDTLTKKKQEGEWGMASEDLEVKAGVAGRPVLEWGGGGTGKWWGVQTCEKRKNSLRVSPERCRGASSGF